MVVKIKHISLVNIILEKLAVQELIQSKLNNNNLISETKKMMNNKQDMLNDYNDLINMLDKKGASKNTGKFIYNSISI
jgi:lipid-A-disaccharide synthase